MQSLFDSFMDILKDLSMEDITLKSSFLHHVPLLFVRSGNEFTEQHNFSTRTIFDKVPHQD